MTETAIKLKSVRELSAEALDAVAGGWLPLPLRAFTQIKAGTGGQGGQNDLAQCFNRLCSNSLSAKSKQSCDDLLARARRTMAVVRNRKQGSVEGATLCGDLWRLLSQNIDLHGVGTPGARTRLDRMRTIAAALIGGLGLEAAHENHRGRRRRHHRQNDGRPYSDRRPPPPRGGGQP